MYIMDLSGNERDAASFIHSLEKAMLQSNDPDKRELLSLIPKHHSSQTGVWNLKEDETILHVAIKMRASCHVVSAIVDSYPPLLSASRENSTSYRGQTALHIALTVGDTDVIELLLQKARMQGTSDILRKILDQKATGTRFENTVMQGELPLSVATLTLNSKLFDTILMNGARLEGKNSFGDNLCHSLIKYSHLYPEKSSEVMKMLEHLKTRFRGGSTKAANLPTLPPDRCIKDSDFNTSYIWMARNNAGYNPLKLAAELGQHAIFKFIMELRQVYCHVNSDDGLFDVELYDVTDIELNYDISLATKLNLDKAKYKVFPYNDRKYPLKSEQRDTNIPTLEMIFKNDPATVFKFIELTPLRYVINRKWRFYRCFYSVSGIAHMLFMIGYTVYAVRRSNMVDASYRHRVGSDVMVTVYLSISVLFAVIYLFQEIVRIVKGQMPWTMNHVMNCYHNGPFRLMLVMFSVTVLADVVWKMIDDHYRDYFLICSVILGWWFIVFFLRGFKQFSFFTVMIQKVLVGDMFRFSIIIGMELIAFTTGMYIAFREMNPPDQTVQEFSRLMVQMFKMMFGFTALDVLFDAQQPWLTVCLYVGFVLLTYVLMINSLIAMMSNTCSVVSQNREIQYRVQQMSIILFFESIFPLSWLREVGEPRWCSWYDPEKKEFISRKRLFMEVRSLREVTRSKSRYRMTSETMLESIFNTLKNIQIPIISDKKETAEVAVSVDPVETERAGLHIADEFHVGNEGTGLHNADEYRDREGSINPRRHKKKKKSKKKFHDEPIDANEENGETENENISSHDNV